MNIYVYINTNIIYIPKLVNALFISYFMQNALLNINYRIRRNY